MTAHDREGLISLLREVLPPTPGVGVIVEVTKWGEDLQAAGVTIGGGTALHARLHRLQRAKIIDLHGVRGNHTHISWHTPKRRRRPMRRPITSAQLVRDSTAALGRMLDLAIAHTEVYARPGLVAAKLVYQIDVGRIR
ncbi:MAG TPA: hypothetical protein VKZ50_05100 [bacterium]|nr:hypothetical protein [bacterium]